MQNFRKRLIGWAIVVALILLIPLILTLLGSGVDGDGWHWTLFDFVFMGVLLFGAGLAYELLARKTTNNSYRFAVSIAITASVLLVWINGAVGFIGNENNPANLMYFGVLAIGAVGSLVAHFKPQGMARALLTMAGAQFLVPIIAVIIWRPQFSPGVAGVFVLNAFFVISYLMSAWLFQRAAQLPEANTNKTG